MDELLENQEKAEKWDEANRIFDEQGGLNDIIFMDYINNGNKVVRRLEKRIEYLKETRGSGAGNELRDFEVKELQKILEGKE